MSNISAPVLLRVPKRWTPRWQRVFESLVSPIHLVRSIRKNAFPLIVRDSSPSLSEEELQAYRSDALSVDRQMLDTLDDLHGVAMKTWQAGWEIRMEAGSVLFQLRDLEVLERISIPRYREPLLAEIRAKVIERSGEFREIPLLEELLNAMTADKDDDLLPGTNEQPAGDNASDNDSFHELRQFAADNFKGIERRIVELICEHAGACPLPDLATDPAIKWVTPWDDAFNSAKKRINAKLKKPQWKIYRHDRKAKVKFLGRE